MDYSDSDSDSDSFGTGIGPPSSTHQPAVGYNSYGRPSMGTMTMNNSFEQNTSYELKRSSDDSSSSEDDDSDNDSDSDNDEAAPIVPRGKSFCPPVGDGDSLSSSEDDGNVLKPPHSATSSNGAIATAQINPNPGAPRGKELRLPQNHHELSSDDGDDEPLANKKRKAPASGNNSDDSESESSVCIATIVDTDAVPTAVATNINSKQVKANDGTAIKKKPGIQKGATFKKDGSVRKKPGPKKGSTKGVSKKTSASSSKHVVSVSAENAVAANAARTKLEQKVTHLPHRVSSSHTVRSFGRIMPEYKATELDDTQYANPHSIYPVGFSCDRFEFSPIHGRIIKMRCDVLDGKELRERREHLENDTKMSSSGDKDMDSLGNGPIFRVTWGEGVEEDKVTEPSCPFDPYVASAHLSGDVDAIAVPAKKGKAKSSSALPEVGMRVSVRFDKCKMYGGSITKVKPMEKQSRNKKALCNISIKYDDGVTETTAYPDPDIVVAMMAGCPPVESEDGLVTEMNGKLVRSVLGNSPIEAWGKTLLSLGLIDEIMYESALQALHAAREEGFNEVKDRIDAANKKRREDRAKEKLRRSLDGNDDKSQGTSLDKDLKDDDGKNDDADKMDTGKEAQSPEEIELRKTLAEMQNKLAAAKKRSKAVSVKLADTRITTISPFAANPFHCRDDSTKLETSWMAAAIKNEKSKMGNTGNKKKFVNPATMMDKSDTFFSTKIARLIEGLPGTELAPSYVFHTNRSSSGGNQWVHEAKLRHQKQQQKKQDMAGKPAKHVAAKSTKSKIEQEKVLKRKLKEQQETDRKRHKEEEENEKKKKRVEKRMALLNNQMDDRLFKEACMMRERNVMNFVRGLNKEFARRKKAAELTTSNKVERMSSSRPVDSSSNVLVPFGTKLPPLSRTYEAEVVRVWDFLHSFSEAFSSPGTQASLPSLDSVQDAFDCLKTSAIGEQSKRSNAINLFESIAIDLCKVISPSLTKILSSSIQNIEVIGKNGTEGGPQTETDVSCLPVTKFTWREVARMAIIHDVLTDLGYSKQDSANLVKGYRSGGHPNSKEAKRWKKIEESNVVMMYHRIANNNEDMNQFRSRVVRAIMSTPCTPSSVPTDWRFFLHNIKSRSQTSASFVKDNVTKALAALKNITSEVKDPETHIANLEKCLATVECSDNGSNAPELHRAKQLAISVLDSTREKYSLAAIKDGQDLADPTHAPRRQKMGFQNMYHMSREQFKALEQSKEEYMAAALKLKEDLERKSMDGANDEDEDDDDDDEDGEGDAQNGKEDKETSAPEPQKPDGEVSVSAAKFVENGETKQDELEKAETNAQTAISSDKSTTMPSDDIDEKKEDEKDIVDSKPSCEADDTGNAEEPVSAADGTGNAEEPVEEQEELEFDASDLAAIDATGHHTVGEKDEHIPTEPAGNDFPDGWVFRRIPRTKAGDPRTDRNYYSPKLGLRFRQKSDAKRFIEKLEEANGDEADAILKYHGKAKPQVVGKKNPVGRPPKNRTIEKVTPAPSEAAEVIHEEYDFTKDVTLAPDLIRRCLSVVRALSASSSAEQFIYPVDPQLYPSYYETVMNPMSLYDVGKFLQDWGHKFSSNHDDPEIEEIVANMARKVRTIVQNSIIVNSANVIVNSAEEMLRIFERLFFEWVLAPSKDRPDLVDLDDDRCINPHESDLNSMVLICDACEAKYNMTRLKPAILRVPKGDWYCPRCIASRSWLTADPRLGRKVKNNSMSGTVQSCKFIFTEDGQRSIVYCIKSASSGRIEFWGVDDVDKWILGGEKVEPIRCMKALAESPGYGFGRDSGIVGGALPLAINPFVGDKAADAALSSSVFKETVASCVALTNAPEEFTAEEWTNLLMLLVTKCSQSDTLQELASNIESKEHSRFASGMMTFWRARGAQNIIPNNSDDDDTVSSKEEEQPSEEAASETIPSVIESKTKLAGDEQPPPAKTEPNPTDVVMKSSGEEVPGEEILDEERPPTDMDISFQSSTSIPDEASSNAATNTTATAPSSKDDTKEGDVKDAVVSKEKLLQKKREATLQEKAQRDKKREEALVGYYIGNRLKSTAASFDEDFISTVVKTTLCNQEEGLDFSAVRCRETCHYCGISDIAMGAPLCRTPNEQEWKETFPYAVHNRTTYTIAEVPADKPKEEEGNGIIEPPSEQTEKKTKLVSVRVRVGGDLVSAKSKSIHSVGKNESKFDAAMQQFLPLNPVAFQSELKFRQEKNISFLTGSVPAHEVCAAAAHKSRKDKALAKRRSSYRLNKTREAAIACGKSIPIGNDPFGRSYWVFSAEPSSLFVCSSTSATSPESKQWHRFHKAEEVASVMVCLDKNSLLYESLTEVFPEATKMIKDRTWSTLLFERCLAPKEEGSDGPPVSDKPMADAEEQDYGPPFVEDEDVIVESEKGKFLWDAVVVDVSKDPDTGRVNGYLVHYKNWSTRFDQWVAPDRVVEPNKTNTEVQGEVLQDFSVANDAAPPVLEQMFAYQFLNTKKRARSTPVTKTEIFDSAFTRPSASQDEKLLSQLKGAILLIEAALPRGSVGSSANWNQEAAAMWRNFVKDAQGPESLMKCVLLLENAISSDYFHSQATQLYASIPTYWRAMGEASLSAIALRVSILDRCLKYQQHKKKKHSL